MTNIPNILKSSTNNDNNNNNLSNMHELINDINNSIYHNKNLREKIDFYVTNNNVSIKEYLTLKDLDISQLDIIANLSAFHSVDTEEEKRINSLIFLLNLQNGMYCKISNCI